MRRIDVLRTAKERRPLSRPGLVCATGVLALTAIFVGALRGPAAPPAEPNLNNVVEPFELRYLFPEDKNLVAFRPCIWFEQPGMDKFAETVEKEIDIFFGELQKKGLLKEGKRPKELALTNIEQVVTDLRFGFAGSGFADKKGDEKSMVMGAPRLIRLKTKFDWAGFLRSVSPNLKETQSQGVSIYEVTGFGPTPAYAYIPDERTLVFADAEARLRKLVIESATAPKRQWCTGWPRIERAPLAIVIGNEKVLAGFADLTPMGVVPADKKALDELVKENKSSAFPDLKTGVASIKNLALGVELGDGATVRLLADMKSAETAAELAAAITFYRPLARQFMPPAPEVSGPEKVWLQLVGDLLRSFQVKQEGARLELEGRSGARVGDFLKVMGR